MSKIGNHRTALQESDAYKWGWDWAALGAELHGWIEAHFFGPAQEEAARLGWQDYHDQEKNDGQ